MTWKLFERLRVYLCEIEWRNDAWENWNYGNDQIAVASWTIADQIRDTRRPYYIPGDRHRRP